MCELRAQQFVHLTKSRLNSKTAAFHTFEAMPIRLNASVDERPDDCMHALTSYDSISLLSQSFAEFVSDKIHNLFKSFRHSKSLLLQNVIRILVIIHILVFVM